MTVLFRLTWNKLLADGPDSLSRTESPVAVGLEVLLDFSTDGDRETALEGNVFYPLLTR